MLQLANSSLVIYWGGKLLHDDCQTLHMTISSLRILKTKAAIWALALLGVETLIALFVRDAWVRPYGGDVLAALLVYVALRAVATRVTSAKLACCAFAIGCAVELAQFLQLPARLGVTRYAVLRIVVGTTFQWGDLVAYAIGALLGWLLNERTRWLESPEPHEQTTGA